MLAELKDLVQKKLFTMVGPTLALFSYSDLTALARNKTNDEEAYRIRTCSGAPSS